MVVIKSRDDFIANPVLPLLMIETLWIGAGV